MSDKPDDGGSAFSWLERVESWKHREPHEDPEVYYLKHPGMTLRQWYAGLAMQGLLAHNGGDWGDLVAKDAAKEADALIAELKK